MLDHLRQSVQQQDTDSRHVTIFDSWREIALGASLLAGGMVLGLGFVAAGVGLVAAVAV